MEIFLSEPKAISQAPPEIRGWGPWQFPRLFDGGDRVYLESHVEADSAKAYGKPRAWFESMDGGTRWTQCDNGGTMLPGGDLVKPYQPASLPAGEISLPQKIGTFVGYGITRDYFDYADVDPQFKHWYLERKSPGGDWRREEIEVELPDYTMNTSEGVFPLGYLHQLKPGPNGSVWTVPYKHFIENGTISRYGADWFLRSDDGCKTFQYVSRVPYAGDPSRDAKADKRYGFAEGDICFLDECKGFALHRTTDGHGIGPLYITWTDDGARTWTDPEYFDDRGVWPQTVTLGNGVTLAGYGRTGLFVRPWYDGKWFERKAVVEPGPYQTETCSYCALHPVDNDTALIAYSDFNYPDEQGRPRKSMMVRFITVKP